MQLWYKSPTRTRFYVFDIILQDNTIFCVHALSINIQFAGLNYFTDVKCLRTEHLFIKSANHGLSIHFSLYPVFQYNSTYMYTILHNIKYYQDMETIIETSIE